MNLRERIENCDQTTGVFFNQIIDLMRENALYGWLPMDAAGLARHFSVSHSYCYAKLESLRAQGILARGKKGYYCPALIAAWIATCKK